MSSLSLSDLRNEIRKNLEKFDEEDRNDPSKLYKKELLTLKPRIYPDDNDDDDNSKVIEIGGFKWYSTFLIFYFIYYEISTEVKFGEFNIIIV